MPSASGDDIGNDAIFERAQPVFQRQLFLLHALNLQRITARRDHGVYRGVEIGMVLLQTRKFESNLGLFLLGHYLPYIKFDARRMLQRVSD